MSSAVVSAIEQLFRVARKKAPGGRGHTPYISLLSANLSKLAATS